MTENHLISFENLKSISIDLRKRIITTSSECKIPHLGSCLSCIDLLTYIYWYELSINPSEPTDINRDRFVLSKGHGAPALFQVLAEKGFFPKTGRGGDKHRTSRRHLPVGDLYFSSHIAVFLHPSSFCRWGRSREVVGCAASE